MTTHTPGQRGGLMAIYSVMLLLMFHFALVAYINSSYLTQFMESGSVGVIYFIGSALTVFIFLFISYILRKVGNYRITLLLLACNFLAVSGMAFANSLAVALPLFLIHLTVLPLLLFNLDVFLEALIGNNEGTTGSKRGLLLALTSFIGAISPLLSGFIIDNSSFTYAYLLSALTLFPIAMILVFHFRHFQDPKYHEIKLLKAMRSFWKRHNIRMVFLSHFLLQVFFCFMVIYTPLYLATEINLSWSAIGIIIFAGQLAYAFFEYPIGYYADNHVGEKEMMAAGFLILAISSAFLAAIATTAIIIWIVAMFVTRVGASLVEVTTESYFFKHTKSSDAQIISFFRITRPLAYVIGALLGSLSLLYLPFNFVFITLGFLMILGIISALLIPDTK
ncbi:MAG: MFS transporter [Candidatus Paceibacterota bacterium]